MNGTRSFTRFFAMSGLLYSSIYTPYSIYKYPYKYYDPNMNKANVKKMTIDYGMNFITGCIFTSYLFPIYVLTN